MAIVMVTDGGLRRRSGYVPTNEQIRGYVP